jgi:hypothetical protein
MNNRKIIFMPLAVLALCTVLSCEKTYAPDNGGDDTNKGYDGIKEDDDDYTGNNSDTVFVFLKGSSATSSNTLKASASSTAVTIKSGGTYCISGTFSNGQIIVNTSEKADVRLVLKGATITCSKSSPIYVQDAQKVIIVTVAGTKSYLTDGTSYVYTDAAKMEPDACIFSKSDLTFYGNGSLYVTGKFKNGISGKDGLIIKSGTINVNSAKDGIRGKDYLLIYDGNITVTSAGDGLKSTNSSDAGAGFVWVKGGTFVLTSATDAISAYSKVTIDYADMTIKAGGGSGTNTTTQGYSGTVSAKGIKAKSTIEINEGNLSINSADDAINCDTSFVMNGGTLSISTMDDAVHSPKSLTVNGGTLTVTKAYEGFEGSSVNLTGGNVTLAVTDDAINATKGSPTEYDDGSVVTVTGGTIILNSSSGDGLDSNGSATMTGGTFVIQGPSSAPEVGIDVNGSFNIGGGFLIASGPNSGNMIEGPSNSSSQYSVLLKGSSTISNTSIACIQDGAGKELVAFKPVRNAAYLVLSSPLLASGTTYTLFTGGTYTGGTNIGGYYSGGTFSGGTSRKVFTLSSKATTVTF